MNKDIEQLNNDWKKYIKWMILFPLILFLIVGFEVILGGGIIISAIFPGSSETVFLIILGVFILVIIATLIAFIIYIHHFIKLSNKLFTTLKINKYIAVPINLIALIFIIPSLIFGLPLIVMDIIQYGFDFSKGLINLLFLTCSMPLFLRFKIIRYWQSQDIEYNWIGLIKKETL